MITTAPKRAACGNADDARVRHRVSEQSLHRRSGNSEGHAHAAADDYPRQSDLLDYQFLGPAELRNVRSHKRKNNGGHVPCGVSPPVPCSGIAEP